MKRRKGTSAKAHEVAQRPSEGQPRSEFRHGPLRSLVPPTTPTWGRKCARGGQQVAPKGQTQRQGPSAVAGFCPAVLRRAGSTSTRLCQEAAEGVSFGPSALGCGAMWLGHPHRPWSRGFAHTTPRLCCRPDADAPGVCSLSSAAYCAPGPGGRGNAFVGWWCRRPGNGRPAARRYWRWSVQKAGLGPCASLRWPRRSAGRKRPGCRDSESPRSAAARQNRPADLGAAPDFPAVGA